MHDESKDEPDQGNCKSILEMLIMYILFVSAFYAVLWQSRVSEGHEPGNPLAFFILFTVVVFCSFCLITLVIWAVALIVTCFHAMVGIILKRDVDQDL